MASGSSKSSKPRVSPVWEHFEKVAPDKVRCFHCFQELSYSGSTSNMLNHMRNKHREPASQNPELRKKQADLAMVNMLMSLSWPFSCVKSEGFREMVKVLDPNYVIPSPEELKALRNAHYGKPKGKDPADSSDSE